MTIETNPHNHGNEALRRARERAGWSREVMAARLDTSPFTIYRWEHGHAKPGPYYRQKLMILFQQSAEELGLLTRIEEDAKAPLINELQTAVPLPFLAAPPIAASHFIGRSQEITALLKNLQQPGRNALVGIPGVGKTALAAHMAHVPAVMATYPDGILWLGFGPEPTLSMLLSQLALWLGLPNSEIVRIASNPALAQRVQALVGDRRLLVIIDDIWRIEDLAWFTIIGNHTSLLITTRFPAIAHAFALERTISIPEFDAVAGLQLIQQLAPQVAKNYPDQMRELVASVGGLPLALTLVGRYLQTQFLTQQPRRLQAAVGRLRQPSFWLELAEPAPLFEHHRWQEVGGTTSLYNSIDLSMKSLSDPVQDVLRTSTMFPAKPNSFTEDAGCAISGMAPEAYLEALDTLVDAGLIEIYQDHRYTIHQTIGEYAYNPSLPPNVVRRLVAYYLAFTQAAQEDYKYVHLDSEITNILAALEMAYQHHLIDDFVQLTQQVILFLLNRGRYADAHTYLDRCRTMLGEAANLPEHIGITLLSGIAMRESGNLDAAMALAMQAETIAHAYGLPEMHAAALKLQGQIHQHLGKVDRAESAFQQARDLIHDQTTFHPINRALDTAIIIGLVQCAGRRGAYAQAEALAYEGLALARRTGKAQSECIFLSSLGIYASLCGRHEQGYQFFLDALEIARHHRFVDTITTLCANLAQVATEQGRWETAQTWAEESLSRARHMSTPANLMLSLSNLAAILLEQQRYDEAEELLQEGLALAEQTGDMSNKVFLTHSRARSARLQDRPDAEIILQDGKRLAQRAQIAYTILEFDLELGEWYLTHQQWDAALDHFTQAHQAAEHANAHVRSGQALFGRARTVWEMGDHATASPIAQSSLEIFQQANSYHARAVEQWLAMHPADGHNTPTPM